MGINTKATLDIGYENSYFRGEFGGLGLSQPTVKFNRTKVDWKKKGTKSLEYGSVAEHLPETPKTLGIVVSKYVPSTISTEEADRRISVSLRPV